MANAAACTFGQMLASWLSVFLLFVAVLGVLATARAVIALKRHGARGERMAESLSHLILTGGDRDARKHEAKAKEFLRAHEYESLGDSNLTKYASAARIWFKCMLVLGISLMVVGAFVQSLGSPQCLLAM